MSVGVLTPFQEPAYPKQDPIVRLVGGSKEIIVGVKGRKGDCPKISGAQVSMSAKGFCKQLLFENWTSWGIVHLEEMGVDSAILGLCRS